MKQGPQAFTPDVKYAIRVRQSGRCAMCGLSIPDGAGHYHHRKPRRMGGGMDPRVGTPANGVLLHPKCHDRIESDRLWAVQRGWLLAAAEYPEEVPLRTWEGWMLLFGSDAAPCAPPDLEGLPQQTGHGTASPPEAAPSSPGDGARSG